MKEIVPAYGLGGKNIEKRLRWSAISLRWPPYDLYIKGKPVLMSHRQML